MTRWTRREDRLAIKHPAELVARITGRTLAEVKQRQRELEQLPKLGNRKGRIWTRHEDGLVLTRPASEVSQLIGRTFREVHRRRALLRSTNQN